MIPREIAAPSGLAPVFAASALELASAGPGYDRTAEFLQRKLSGAFRHVGVTEADLGETTGYGYGDRGRRALEEVFALAFDAEAALVRPHLVSGTQALSVALFALLAPGDVLLSATGPPYDTLKPVIGPGPLSLEALGVRYREFDPWAGGTLDLAGLAAAARAGAPRVVLVQRSRGYSVRPALLQAKLEALLEAIRDAAPRAAVVVDNCYSEFVEDREPAALGADLSCGSLIKNPGGGLAPTGGYVAGRAQLVDLVAGRLYAPGLGREVGPSLVPIRLLLQGLYLAPAAVAAALKVAEYAASVFARLGYEVLPQPGDERGDIVQAIRLGSRRRVESFCAAIQSMSPVDSRATPEFAALPGYQHQVIMAAGTFVQGASLELSADAPDREPYWVFLQGGLGLGYGMAAVEAAAAAVGPR
ncbi:MAG: methionine gamma-lyase family protein [Bacillota bacterium]|nr:methionine gamma-lyase family protein [Bacillota bacterium]